MTPRPVAPAPGPGPGPVTPAPGVPAGYITTPPARPRRTNWLMVTVAAVIAAIIAGVALALTLSSGPAGSTGGAAASGGPTGGTASASPASTSTLIAVTVCSQPADGCTYAGASQIMEVKPKQIVTSGDGSAYADGLTWSNWGSPQATATGTLKVDNCNPNCAQGTDTSYPATVTLAGLKPYGTGLEAYSTIVVQAPSANLTFTYTKDTVP